MENISSTKILVNLLNNSLKNKLLVNHSKLTSIEEERLKKDAWAPQASNENFKLWCSTTTTCSLANQKSTL